MILKKVIFLCRLPQLWFHFLNFISMKRLGRRLFQVVLVFNIRYSCFPIPLHMLLEVCFIC